MGLNVPDRVHIMAVGYEYDRIVRTAEENRADKVVLIGHDNDDPRGKEYWKAVIDWFEESDIAYEPRRCDIFDMYDSLSEFAAAISEHSDDDVYVNVSSGTKVTAIAGMISSVVMDATAYYAKAVSYPQENDHQGSGSQEDSPSRDRQAPKDIAWIDELPPFPIDAPDEEQVIVMEFISRATEREGPPTKGELIYFCKQSNLSFLSGGSDNKADYRLLDSNILSPLSERGYIDVTKHGRSKIVSLTPNGEGALDVFRWMVEPNIDWDTHIEQTNN